MYVCRIKQTIALGVADSTFVQACLFQVRKSRVKEVRSRNKSAHQITVRYAGPV